MAAAVYVMRTNSGQVKVGHSGTPYTRLSKVKQDYAPARGFTHLDLIGFVLAHDPMLVERIAIRRLVQHATGGEWFRCDAYEALDVVLNAARAWDDPDAEITWPSCSVRWRQR